MSLLEILGASRDVVAAVSGIQSAYRLVPEKAPVDDATTVRLPCAIQEPLEGDVLLANSQRHIVHRWYLDILVGRDGDTQAEQAAKITLLPLVIAAFDTHMGLGMAEQGVRNCRPLRYEMLTVSLFDQAYSAVRITMQAEEKYAATFSA